MPCMPALPWSEAHVSFYIVDAYSFCINVGFVFSRLFTYLKPVAGIWLIYHLSNLHSPQKNRDKYGFHPCCISSSFWKGGFSVGLNSNLVEFRPQTKHSFLLWRHFLLYCPHKRQWGHPSSETKIENGIFKCDFAFNFKFCFKINWFSLSKMH